MLTQQTRYKNMHGGHGVGTSGTTYITINNGSNNFINNSTDNGGGAIYTHHTTLHLPSMEPTIFNYACK